MSRGRGRLATIVLAFLATASCVCPRVYRIAGPGEDVSPPPPSPTYGVLFLSSGFERGELPAYQLATYELASGLLLEEPFSRYGNRIRFYRIDLVGMHPKSECREDYNCNEPLNAPDPSRSLPPGTALDHDPKRPALLKLDLGVRLCRGGSSGVHSGCGALSLGAAGQGQALDLAGCVSGIDAVVVVVNLNYHAGLTRQDGLSSALGLAVIGVPLAQSPGGPGSPIAQVSNGPAGSAGNYVTADAIHLVAHELGHALGLFDEYVDSGITPERSLFRPGRNVWREPVEAPLVCYSGGSLLPIPSSGLPWSSLPPGSLVCCTGHDPVPDPVLTTERDCNPKLLWEGALYKPDGYFRAAEACRMNWDISESFCTACLLHLDRILRQYTSEPENAPQ